MAFDQSHCQSMSIQLLAICNCVENNSARICVIQHSSADLPELRSKFAQLGNILAAQFSQFCQSHLVGLLRLPVRERGLPFSAVRGPKLVCGLQVHEQLPAVECLPCRSSSSIKQRSIIVNVRWVNDVYRLIEPGLSTFSLAPSQHAKPWCICLYNSHSRKNS
jgi:hypothetical protein